jgi:hypothetical protein
VRYADDPSRPRLDSSNVPGNPLRSFRMSMLAHGFVDRASHNEFELDESDPVTYGVVRLPRRRRKSRWMSRKSRRTSETEPDPTGT